MVVIKRDGRTAEFDKSKIESAIQKAFESCEVANDEARRHSLRIAEEISRVGKCSITVEEIQDLIEKKLMASSHKDVAKAFITYRQLRSMARSKYNDLMSAVEEKLKANDVENQNANVDERSFGGRVGEASNLVMKKYALDYCVSPMARNNHLNNEIYIHDLSAYAVGMHNCLSIPFDDLLANGFNTRQTDVRPANSVNTAFQLVAVLFQLQSLQQFGGVSATHLDWTMVPYVRKSFLKHYVDGMQYISPHLDRETPETHKRAAFYDYFAKHDIKEESIESDYFKAVPEVYNYAMEKTKTEVYQAVEGMYHNLNN